MNESELYEFDRNGYVVIDNMLSAAQVDSLRAAIDALEVHALPRVKEPPRKKSPWGAEYHANQELGYHVNGANEEGQTLIIEDVWNGDAAFDLLVDHPRTMEYVKAVIKERPTINNSEIRIRYKGNATGSHGGGPVAGKYQYQFTAKGIDCKMVRMVYFVQDVNDEQGAFSVVPGTHKGNLPSPYGNNPDEEPGMIGLQVKAGDAIFFTEHLRHGGLTNRSDQVRKTIHVGYGPHWMLSQNISTMDGPQHITESTLARYSEAQRDYFRTWPEANYR